jgi:hypothetical protein
VFETIDNSQKEPENKNEIQKFTINNNSVKFNVFENAAILDQLNRRLQQLTNSNIELLGNERNVTTNVIRRLIDIINIKAQMAQKPKNPIGLNESIHFLPPPPPTSQPGEPSNIIPSVSRRQIETNTFQPLLPPSSEQTEIDTEQSEIGEDQRSEIGEDQESETGTTFENETIVVNNKIQDLFKYISDNKSYLPDTVRNFIQKFNFRGNNDNGIMFTNLITSKASRIHVKLIGPGGGGGTSTGSSMGSGGGSGSYYEGILDILDRTNSYEPKIFDYLFVYVGKGLNMNYNNYRSEAYKTYIGRKPVLSGGGFGSNKTIVYANGGTQGMSISTTEFLTDGGSGGGLMTPYGINDSAISRFDIVNSMGQNGGNAYYISSDKIISGIGGRGYLGNIGGGGNQSQSGLDGIAIISW